jgi:hypothetical protein
MGLLRGFIKLGVGFTATYLIVWGNHERFIDWYNTR